MCTVTHFVPILQNYATFRPCTRGILHIVSACLQNQHESLHTVACAPRFCGATGDTRRPRGGRYPDSADVRDQAFNRAVCAELARLSRPPNRTMQTPIHAMATRWPASTSLG